VSKKRRVYEKPFNFRGGNGCIFGEVFVLGAEIGSVLVQKTVFREKGGENGGGFREVLKKE